MRRQTLPIFLALFPCLACALAANEAAERPPRAPAEELRGLRAGHPRIYLTPESLQRLRAEVKTDPLLRAWHAKLLAQGERMLTRAPVRRELVGPRLLAQSRAALDTISTCGLLYLLGGDRRFAERARADMLAAAAFRDWNPSHFLDAAEMTHSLGIGYDWLYDFLTNEEKKAVRNALIELGIKPGIDAFEADRPPFWTRATHNWSNVCNGGLTVGALAIAEENPTLAANMLRHARRAIRPSMRAYSPDGGFAEGPGYWRYATRYTAYYLTAIETALGEVDPIAQTPGFDRTGDFRVHSIGPADKAFNYADAGDAMGTAPEMFLLARLFDRPAYARDEVRHANRDPSPFHLLWYHAPHHRDRVGAGDVAPPRPLPLDALFRGAQVAMLRSSWNPADALYVGIKGGDNRANHSHLDLGSFILDSQAQRFAVDLGPDDYNLPGYFGRQRWSYYRLRTESHNTLTLDGENQATDGKAPIVAFHSSDRRSHVVVDLTHAYRNQADRVQRGIALIDGRTVLVQDEVEARDRVDVAWNFLTRAEAEVDGRSAILTLGKARLALYALEPRNATFEVASARRPRPERPNDGFRNVRLRLPSKVESTRIVVVITRPGDPRPNLPPIDPLPRWPSRLPDPN